MPELAPWEQQGEPSPTLVHGRDIEQVADGEDEPAPGAHRMEPQEHEEQQVAGAAEAQELQQDAGAAEVLTETLADVPGQPPDRPQSKESSRPPSTGKPVDTEGTAEKRPTSSASTPRRQADMEAAEGTSLAQLAATCRQHTPDPDGPGATVGRLPSGNDRGLKTLKSLSRQSSLARSTGTNVVAGLGQAPDASTSGEGQAPGAADSFQPEPSMLPEDSDGNFSSNSATPPHKPASQGHAGHAEKPGTGGKSSRGADGIAPSSSTDPPAAGRAGGSRQGSKPEHGLPPPPRPKGAAPFMERHASPGALGPKRLSGQGDGSEKAPALKPLKGLAAHAGSPQRVASPEGPSSGAGQGPAGVGSPLRHVKSAATGLGVSPSEMHVPHGLHAQALGSMTPDEGSMMDGLFLVRGMRERHMGPLLAQQRKTKKPGRLNFRNLFGPPAHTGGGTLPPSMIKDGLQRRAAAAAMTARGPPPFVRKTEPRPPTPEGVKLDGFMMLEAGDEDLPEHVVAAKLAHRNIDSVEVADMAYFPSLKVLDLSDNRVAGIEGLAGLIGLRQLSLASNRMHTLGNLESDGAFRELQVLDLTYNLLRPSVLAVDSPLAGLPHLCELDLSGNSLSSLPDELGNFPSLTLLRLNNNRLSGAALVPLGALPSLKELSLSGNVVTAAYDDAAEPGSFPQLRLLDLTHNKISEEEAVAPLRLIPSLRLLLLAGNPLALLQQAAAKRAKEKRGNAPSVDGGPELSYGLQVMYQPLPELPPKVSIATILASHNRQVPKNMDERAVTKAAGEAAIAATSDEALMDAFERVDNAIDAWQLNTVDEEDEEEEDTGPVEEDGTFLTGIGIEERHKRHKAPKEESEAAPVDADVERPLWEDVTDPTERLALALGLDPRQLAIYTGRLTTDSVGAINALRFALAHPLVEADEGLRPAQHHLGMTTAAKLKRRDRKLAPLAHGAAAAAATPADMKTVRIQTMETMLQGMKDRLKGLESSLAEKLAAAHKAGSLAPAGKVKGSADGLRSDDEDSQAGDEIQSPRSPDLAPGEADDARSDMSALPEDVIDAIENPALSESDEEDVDNFLTDEVDPDASLGDNPQLAAAGTGPAAAVAAAADGGRHIDVPAIAASALGYG